MCCVYNGAHSEVPVIFPPSPRRRAASGISSRLIGRSRVVAGRCNPSQPRISSRSSSAPPPSSLSVRQPVSRQPLEPGGSACCYWNGYESTATTRLNDSLLHQPGPPSSGSALSRPLTDCYPVMLSSWRERDARAGRAGRQGSKRHQRDCGVDESPDRPHLRSREYAAAAIPSC